MKALSKARGIPLVVTVCALLFVMLTGGLGISAQTQTPPATPPQPAILSMSLMVKPPSSPQPTPTATPTPPPANQFDVLVTIEIAGFEIVSNGPNAPGQGHIIYYTGAQPPTIPNMPAITAQGTYFSTTAIPFTWLNVTPGYKHFAAQLVHNDNTPLNPPVFAQIRTNIEMAAAGAPSPTLTAFSLGITPPSSPSPTPNDKFDIVIATQVSDFEIADRLGEPPASGEGHLVYYENMEPRTVPGRPAYPAQGTYYATTFIPFTWTGASADYYSYAVQLVNNDDTPLELPVFAEIRGHLEPGLEPMLR